MKKQTKTDVLVSVVTIPGAVEVVEAAGAAAGAAPPVLGVPAAQDRGDKHRHLVRPAVTRWNI